MHEGHGVESKLDPTEGADVERHGDESKNPGCGIRAPFGLLHPEVPL